MASVVKVLVTHIIDPLNFWARIGTDDELYSIANFVDIVNNYGAMTSASESPDNSSSESVSVGQHVIAKSQLGGGQWRNAIVISAGFSESDDVDVMYLDFGMTEFVPRNHLLIKPPELVLKSYASVHHCQLDGILPLPQGWTRQALAVFSSLVLNQPLRATVVSQSHSISVELFARSESGLRRTIADILVHNGLAMSARASEPAATGEPAELQSAAVCLSQPSESSGTAAAATIPQFDLTSITHSVQEQPHSHSSSAAAAAAVSSHQTGKRGQAAAYSDVHSHSDYVADQFVDIYSRLSEDIKLGSEVAFSYNHPATAGSSDIGNAQKSENRNRRPNRFNNAPRNGGRGFEQSRDRPRLETAADSAQPQTNEDRSGVCAPMNGLRLNEVPAAENRSKTVPPGTDSAPTPKTEAGNLKQAANNNVDHYRTQSDGPAEAKDTKSMRSAETRSKISPTEKQCRKNDAVGSFQKEKSGGNIPKNESGAVASVGRNLGRKETPGSAKPERTVPPRFTVKMSSHHGETDDSAVGPKRSGSAGGNKSGNGKTRRSPSDATAAAESSKVKQSTIDDKKPTSDAGKTDGRKNRKSESSPTETVEAHPGRELASTSNVERVVKKTWLKFDEIMCRYAPINSANKIVEKLREHLVKARSLINEADHKLDDRPLSLCLDVVIDSRLCSRESAGLAIAILSELRSEPDFVEAVCHLVLDYSHRFIRTGNSERREKLCVAFCDFVAELYVVAVSWPDCLPICSVIHGIVDKWAVFDRKGQNSGGSSVLELYTRCLLQFVCSVSTHSVELFRKRFPSIVDAATEKLLSNNLPVSVKEKLLKLLLKVEREKIRQQYSGDDLTQSVPVATTTAPAAAAATAATVCSRQVQTLSVALNDVDCQTDFSMCADAMPDNHHGDEVNSVENMNHVQSTWYPETRDDAASVSTANDVEFPSLAVASSFHEKKHETLFIKSARRSSLEKSFEKNQPVENFSPPVAVHSLAKISADLVAAAGDSRSPPPTLIDAGQFVWTALPRKRSTGSDSGANDGASGSRLTHHNREKPHHGPVLVHSAGGVTGKPAATSAASAIVLADFFEPCQLPATDSSQESDPSSEFVPRFVCTLCGERTHTILQCSRSFGDFFVDS